MRRFVGLLLMGAALTISLSGCGSSKDADSVPTGEIKTAPAGKTNPHGAATPGGGAPSAPAAAGTG